MTLKIAIAQMNATVGDLSGNAAKILDFARRAAAQGARLLLTPELALCGHSPQDLLLRKDFHAACEQELAALAAALPEIDVLVGHPAREDGRCYNAASLLHGGRCVAGFHKRSLSTDELRYFVSGDAPDVVSIRGVRCAVAIGADAVVSALDAADLRLALAASPFQLGQQRLVASGQPLVWANLVGGQDEMVFDGASFAQDSEGRLCCRLPAFEEGLETLDFSAGLLTGGTLAPELGVEAAVYQALVLGVRDYVAKNGFPGVLLGMSGGIDSALTLCVAVDALGAQRVRTVMMPSPYTAQISLDDSRDMVQRLGVAYSEIPIEAAMQTFAVLLAPAFSGLSSDTTEENLQARSRGMLLMALSNKTGALVLTTGNKSETAVGYCTLYGDMAGGFAVLKDVPKTLVYRLSRWRNTQSAVMPERIITRAPSAELKPGQTDQDSLPPYEVLDAIVEAYVENDVSARELVARGYAEADVRRVVRLIRLNEYKRRQAAIGVCITARAFGKDWRHPVTNRFRDTF